MAIITLKQTKDKIIADQKWWKIHFFNFVDDFRYHKDYQAIIEPFDFTDEKMDALLISATESLCDELNFKTPRWFENVSACREPYFVAGLENLKAISIVQSPLRFRIRKIFVLENFLHRV